jgi:hypothetical protein
MKNKRRSVRNVGRVRMVLEKMRSVVVGVGARITICKN